MVKWAIYGGDLREAYCSTGREDDVKQTLGNTIALWTRDRAGIIEWEDADKMAAIAFYYTDLNEREIRGIFRASGEGAYPGEPPLGTPTSGKRRFAAKSPERMINTAPARSDSRSVFSTGLLLGWENPSSVLLIENSN